VEADLKKEKIKDFEVPTMSGKEAVVMELLLRNPASEMYGLELVKDSGKQLKRGTVYVTLSRMEDKHFIESKLEEKREDASGMPRRLYKVTGYGQKIFEAWQMARAAGLQLANGVLCA
jgi:DNA-binding PadR family transcriptional regulator